jgi:hypothetical protein
MTANKINIETGIYTTPEFISIKLNNVEVITSSDWELPEMPLPGGGGNGGGNTGGDNWELPEIPIPNN